VTVRLSFDLPLAYEVSYTLHVSGVRDVVGNAITDDEIGFTFHDVFPPVLYGATVPSESAVDASFNEPLDPGTAEEAGNYELYELGDPSSTLLVTGAALDSSGTVVHLTLGAPLSFATSYVLRVNDVEDLAGNPVAPNSEAVIYETVPPELVSVTQEDMERLLVLFSEPLDETEAQKKSSYALHVTGQPSNVVVIDGAGLLADDVTVRLTLHTELAHGTSYTLHADGVEDSRGNPVPPGSTVEFIAADTYPPQIISVTPENARAVRVYFSEIVDETTAEEASNYEIFQTAAPLNGVTVIGARLLSGGISVRLTLGSDLEAGIGYTLRVSDVRDLAGNPIAEETAIEFERIAPSVYGYIGLYLDANHSHTEVSSSGGFTPFVYYVWCLPSENGMMCAEFMVNASANLIRSTVTSNVPIISVSLGGLSSGISVCFNSCQTDWTWTHQQVCYITSADEGFIEIVEHPEAGAYQFANCLTGYPIEPALIMSRIYVNRSEPPPPPTVTLLESFSAAMKSMGIEVTWRLTAADESIEFFVLRASGEDGAFEEIPSPLIERRGLEFTFRDGSVESGETYRYRVEYRIEDEGNGRRLLFESEPISTPDLPLTLYQNSPNPFNPTTTISYYLPEAGQVVLEIFDVSGRRVACPVNRREAEGQHSVEWFGVDEAGAQMSSGVYFYRLTAGRQTLSRKMVLLR
jgi:hypothetical protein